MDTRITVGMVSRERFSIAAEALERIFAFTDIPFRLIIVDAATPRRYWADVERVLAGHSNVEVIHRDEFLLPGAARNLIVEATGDSDWVCLIDNDVLVCEGWLSRMLQAGQEEGAQVVVPLIMEGSEDGNVHFDRRLGHIRPAAGDVAGSWRIEPPAPGFWEDNGARRWQDFLEDHCVLYQRSLLERVAPFDEDLNTREVVDNSFRIHAAGGRILFEPAARVVFMAPPPLAADEHEFFAFRWNRDRALATIDRVQARWDIVDFPRSVRFVEKRLQLLDTV